jgi:hypothetical protein
MKNDGWLKIRVPRSELEEWKQAALAAEKGLSEYVRERMGEASGENQNHREKRVRRTQAIPVVPGGVGVSAAVSTSSGVCKHGYSANECPQVMCKNFKRRM